MHNLLAFVQAFPTFFNPDQESSVYVIPESPGQGCDLKAHLSHRTSKPAMEHKRLPSSFSVDLY